jgi:phenylacetate-CoA ligase
MTASCQALEAFVTTPLDQLLADGDGQAEALTLFHRAAAHVPAYGTFLREHGVDAGRVSSAADFARLPLTTKDNYFHRHPLPQLCRDGTLSRCDMLAFSSGSTGQATVWPRALVDEYAVAARFEQVFRDSFAADRRRTLAVVCFPLGTWVGGLYTTSCCRHVAAKGYPITVVAPGNNKVEIFRVLETLAASFEQVVLLGYPPFVKDVIDGGRARGIDWPRLAIKLVLAGEVVSETWRALMAERAGMTRPNHDSASLYGTADAGVLGNETPLSIAARRFLAGRPEVGRDLFGELRLPTLVQYDPRSRFFETHDDGTLVVTADCGVPLVRYHIADRGGVMPYAEMRERLATHGFVVPEDVVPRPLPFAWVFGRSHFALSFYGANVFPETLSLALEQPEVRDYVTGRFVMQIATDADHNHELLVAVELAPQGTPPGDLASTAAEVLRATLERYNSEFAHYVPAERRTPRVSLWPSDHPEYFPVGVKHRYSR